MQRLMHRARTLGSLMRLNRPVGFWLLLWPSLWALWQAGAGHPSPKNLVIFLLGALVMRSAGCVMNDIADRHFDGHVERTKHRPLVTGEIPLSHAVGLFAVLCGLALLLVWQLNHLTQLISVGALGLTLLYPFTKRWWVCPQCVLGLAFASAVPMAYAAQANALPPICWLMFTIAVIWPIAYDTLYAWVDRDDDVRLGLHSTAIWFGASARLGIVALYILLFFLLACLGWFAKWGWPYALAWMLCIVIMSYQLIRLHDATSWRWFNAFLVNQWIGFILFVGIWCSF